MATGADSETVHMALDPTKAAADKDNKPDRQQEELAERFEEFLFEVSGFRADREFQILRRLGHGRQGVVIEAVHRGFLDCLTRHALKVFSPTMLPAADNYRQDLKRIARQTSVLQQLYHPNLVQCEGCCDYHGVGILIMELIDGVDLKSLMDLHAHMGVRDLLTDEQWEFVNNVIFGAPEHRVQPGVAIYILRKMLRGLETLHRVGYIHCDIKPSNIMIERFGLVKLIDFGRAASINDPDEYFVGSPMYMAPELHRRRSLSPLVDLYSCGLVTLEMLHGGHLIDPRSDEQTLLDFKESLPDRIGEYLTAAARENDALVNILRRLLAVEPEDRYQNATEADAGSEGAHVIHQQLTRASLDVDYGRELERYIEKRLPPRNQAW